MRRTMIGLAILIIMCAGVRSAMAGDKIDVPKVITKSDAEKILGAPVKDAKGRNQNGTDGYYDSEWSYHAIMAIKGSISTFSMRARRSAASYSDDVFHATRRRQQIDWYRRSW